jgi:hypothetical protein
MKTAGFGIMPKIDFLLNFINEFKYFAKWIQAN